MNALTLYEEAEKYYIKKDFELALCLFKESLQIEDSNDTLKLYRVLLFGFKRSKSCISSF